MIGGLYFVTLTRTAQAIGSSDDEGPTEDDGDEPAKDV